MVATQTPFSISLTYPALASPLLHSSRRLEFLVSLELEGEEVDSHLCSRARLLGLGHVASLSSSSLSYKGGN